MRESNRLTFCPFCNEKMERGKLRSRGGVYFLPDGKKPPLIVTEAALRNVGAIPLPPSPIDIPITFPDAFTCRNCRLIIIEDGCALRE